MQIKEFSLTTNDGLKLYAKEWKPESDAKAVVVLVHGIGEHIGRYEHVAQRYVDANYIFRGFDLRGHGKSDGPRGHALSYDQLVNDIDQFIQMAHTAYPDLPVFLYGHSLGGALVLYFAETCQSNLKGIIATSPGLAPTEPMPAITVAAGKLLTRIAPAFKIQNGLDLSGLARDPEVAEMYRKDPLVHPFISASLGTALLNNGQYIVDHAPSFDLPLLLLQGSADRLVNVPKTAEFASNVPQNLLTYKVFPGFYHELHNEPQKDQVFEEMFKWLERNLN